MRVKKFLAKSLPEAVAQVKTELGTEAVILHIHEVKVGGIFGFFGTKMVQVVAATEEAPIARAPAPSAALSGPALSPVSVQAASAAPAPAAVLTIPAPAPEPVLAKAGGGSELLSVKEEMADMKAMLGQIRDRIQLAAQGGVLEPELEELRSRLTSGGVQEEIAEDLLLRVRDVVVRERLSWQEAARLTEGLMRAELGQPATIGLGGRVVALVGPTGVGKTTTVAKLAAYYTLQKRARVSLIAADTFRVAAVDQLRTYSEILGVPLEVVYDPVEVAAAVARHRHRDLILVDTAGRSPRNQAHMGELKSYMDALQPDETYLVMSLTSAYRDAAAIVDHYEPIGFDRFLFTKWDEVGAPGLIYNMRRSCKRPLSYVTTGQSVPDDIEVADPDKITRAILGD